MESELYSKSHMSAQPNIDAQFARLDEKTAGAIKNLAEKMEQWAKVFDTHVEDDRQLKRDFIEQQRQFDRMTSSLEAISKQLTEISIGFSRTIQDSTAAMSVLRSDVEVLKSDKAFRDLDSNRKEAKVKRWIAVIGILSSMVGVAAGHFWK